MVRNILKITGKMAWGALLLSLAAISVWVFSEGHPLPAFGLAFFATCGVISWIYKTSSDQGSEIDPNAFPYRVIRGCESQDFSIYQATNDPALVMAIAHGEGRYAVVAPTGRESRNDDDCPFSDPFFNGDPGGMYAAPTGDDRF